MGIRDREPVRVDQLVDAEVDRLTIEHLDFTPTCSIRMRTFILRPNGSRADSERPSILTCEQPANSVVICRGCRHASNVCAEHLALILGTRLIICEKCKTNGTPLAVLRIFPIGGA